VKATLGRRRFLGLAALAAERRAAAEVGATAERFDVLDWKLPGDPDLSQRAVVLVPRGLLPDQRVRVLVLLHGLGETSSEAAGVRAWIDRYGLFTSHARLLSPPVAAESKRGDLLPDRIRQINDSLAARPFDGRFVIVCPFTPNVSRLSDPPRALDRLAAWMEDVLLPEVRKRTPAEDSAPATGLDGCSMGGFVGLEIFLRKPALFGAWGGVQSALGEANAPRWADRIARALASAGPKQLHIETSRGDPFHAANVALSRELKQRGVAHDLLVLPGPHDQPWLREAGTLEMLLWHDRALQGR
jgi:hypothetical protein